MATGGDVAPGAPDARAVLDALPTACLVLAPDAPRFTILDANAAYLRATMTECAALVGRGLFEAFPDDPALPEADGERNLRASLMRVLAAAAPDRMDVQRYPVRRPGGSFEQRWWRPLNAPVFGLDGAVARILHTVEDVTAAVIERRGAAEALAASEARARGVLEGMAEGFVLLDRDFHVAGINAEGLRIDGRPREAILGRHLLEVWPEAERLPTWPAYRRAMAERAPVSVEYRHTSAVHDVWLDVRAYPVAEGDGGLAVFYRDMTGRKRDEARLRESEARLRHTVEMNPQIPWTADPRGGITGFSRRWLDVTGLARDAALGEGWTRVPHPDDRGRMVAAWRHAVATGEDYDVEARLRMADGSHRWWRARATARRDAAGAIVEWHGQTEDIHDRKRAEEALRESEAALRRANETLEARVAERTAALTRAVDALHAEALERERAEDALRQAQKMEAVGQLTGGIAHDFNNMLQGIGGALDLMQRRVTQGRAEEAGRLVDVARQGVARAAALTHRLLAFARRQALDPRPVEPDALVRGMEELIRRTAGPGVAVELRLRDGVWWVLCDANGLENALLNLCINARDAMPDGGTLTIATADVHLTRADVAGQDGAAPGEYVEVAVSDTGAGMTPEVAARAFEPFFTTKPIGQGTGLGLSQLHGFVHQSGGFVRLDSAPGRGTTVRLYLPRHVRRAPSCDAGDGVASGAEASERAGAVATVLLVEDEPAVRAVAAEALRERGHAVLEAEDGPAALRLLQSGRCVDVLVTDVGLPGGLNGRQVAEAAREGRPGLPVLFITGYASHALDGRLAPGMDVIGKPFGLDALAAKVRGMVEVAAAASAD